MDILREAHSILSLAGYHVSQVNDAKSAFEFEDSVLYGFVTLRAKPEDIISTWESTQDDFLSRNAASIRHAPEKAWNAYSIFLSVGEPPDEIRCALLKIEEDFRGTRKIARGAIENPDDITKALLPLLPLRNVAAVEAQDFQQRLKVRLELADSQFAALTQGENFNAFVRTLVEG
jgi:hypothetical protein